MLSAMNFDLGQNSSDQVTNITCNVDATFHKKDNLEKSDRITNRYNPAVLVNDWYEKRAVYKPPPDDWASVYATSYTCKGNMHFLNDRRSQKNSKNKIREGVGQDILIKNVTQSFMNNFTTTNDLVYRIFPKDLCGPQKREYRSRFNQYLPQHDYTLDYGNLTKFGNLMEKVKCNNYMNSLPDPRLSATKIHYRKYELKPMIRYPIPSGDKNIPSLSHLDINPNQPFRPHLVKVKV